MKSEHLFILDKHFGSKGVWFLDKFQSTCAIIACITIKVVSSNLVHGEVYSIQHYVSDLQQVDGLHRFPPPIKLTATI
jgi:hypothetical protein